MSLQNMEMSREVRLFDKALEDEIPTLSFFFIEISNNQIFASVTNLRVAVSDYAEGCFPDMPEWYPILVSLSQLEELETDHFEPETLLAALAPSEDGSDDSLMFPNLRVLSLIITVCKGEDLESKLLDEVASLAAKRYRKSRPVCEVVITFWYFEEHDIFKLLEDEKAQMLKLTEYGAERIKLRHGHTVYYESGSKTLLAFGTVLHSDV